MLNTAMSITVFLNSEHISENITDPNNICTRSKQCMQNCICYWKHSAIARCVCSPICGLSSRPKISSANWIVSHLSGGISIRMEHIRNAPLEQHQNGTQCNHSNKYAANCAITTHSRLEWRIRNMSHTHEQRYGTRSRIQWQRLVISFDKTIN